MKHGVGGEGAAHVALGAGLAVALLAPSFAKTGVDFGLAGILMVPALRLALDRPCRFGPWLVLAILALNWHGWHPRGEAPAPSACLDAATVAVGLIGIAWMALRFEGRARFLPAHALQVFYPAHLAVLAALRALGLGA